MIIIIIIMIYFDYHNYSMTYHLMITMITSSCRAPFEFEISIISWSAQIIETKIDWIVSRLMAGLVVWSGWRNDAEFFDARTTGGKNPCRGPGETFDSCVDVWTMCLYSVKTYAKKERQAFIYIYIFTYRHLHRLHANVYMYTHETNMP